MKKLFISTTLLLCLSCDAKKNSLTAEEKKDTSAVTDVIAVDNEDQHIQLGNFRVEGTIKGKGDADFWEKGLKDVKYHIYRDDRLLIEIGIEKEEFSNLYTVDFGDRSRIWDSEILRVDTLNKKIIIGNRFGLPESDNHTYVLCIADFNGTKSFIDSSPDCSSGTNISFDKIANCHGVYSYSGPIHEFDQCCTVFSDLLNSRTLFYVVDWQKNTTDTTENAFLIDIHSKDTLEGFVFRDYTYSLGYEALIGRNEHLDIIGILDSKSQELIVYDTLLNTATFDLKTIPSVDDLDENPNTIVLHNEVYGPVIIEFNEMQQPARWKK